MGRYRGNLQLACTGLGLGLGLGLEGGGSSPQDMMCLRTMAGVSEAARLARPCFSAEAWYSRRTWG